MEYVKKERLWNGSPSFFAHPDEDLLTQKSDGAEITCFLVKVPVGKIFPNMFTRRRRTSFSSCPERGNVDRRPGRF